MKESLIYLNLGNTAGKDIEPWQAGEIIYYLENLTSLGGYPFAGTSINELWHYDPKPYPLRYVHDRKTTQETTEIMAQALPNLGGIYLDTPLHGALAPLSKFSHLRKVKLSKANATELTEALSSLPNLLSLELVTLRGVLDLSSVGSACPVLENFQMYYCEGLTVSNSLDLKLERIKKLVIYDTESAYCAKPILKKSPTLSKVQLCDCSDITDEELFGILDANPLRECEEISFHNCPFLTIESIRYMITCMER